MQPTRQGRALAIRAVQDEMRAQTIYNGTGLAEAAGVNADTVNDFLRGRRWPRGDTFAKIEQALGMPTGIIEALGAEEPPAVAQAQAASSATTGSAKTLDEASDVELLMALLARATARLSDSSAADRSDS